MVPEKKKEFKFAVRSEVVKFGVAFYKDVYSDWVERHMHWAVCWGFLFCKGMQDMS